MMPRTALHSNVLAVLTVGLLISMPVRTALAAEREFRNYLDVEYTTMKLDRGVWRLTLKPFLRLENRFRGGDLVYQQWNIGLRLRLLSWMSIQEYYTPRVQMYSGMPQVSKDVVGSDILLISSIGPLRLLNRQANEWHMTDRFYRYRNFMEVTFQMPLQWLSLAVNEEIRVDAD